jgi:SAM-dependent methyltransferase
LTREPDPTFRTDLFRGTASFYDRYRVPYPDSLVTDLVDRMARGGGGRLLDLACGTGQVTFPLCSQFAEVWAVDQEPETVAFAREKAAANGVDNVRWIAGRAEDIDEKETFDVVSVGNAFHRLDRQRIAALAMRWLPPGGHLALLWSDTPWSGPSPWQRALNEVFLHWTRIRDATDRVPAGLEAAHAARPNRRVLRDAGFAIVARCEFVEVHEWNVESLTGLVYSTSVLPLGVLGTARAAFEVDLRDRLLAVEPSGVFRAETSFAYDLARRP